MIHSASIHSIDATIEPRKVRMGRLISHATRNVVSPNVVPKVYTMPNGKPRIYFKALTDIAKGEELSYRYGDSDKITIDLNPWLA